MPKPPHSRGSNQPRIVGIALRDQHQTTAQMGFERVHFLAKLCQEMSRRGIEDRMHRVQTQSVAMVIPQPHQRVVAEETAHFGAARPVEIYGLPPGRRIFRGEIRTEPAKIITGRAQMIVDHVQQNRETARVARIDQRFQSLRTPVGMMRREQIHRVISPAPSARKFSDRHQFDMGDSQVSQIIQALDRAFESADFRKRADVQLIDNGGRKRRSLPVAIGPPECGMIDPSRRSMNAIRLPRRAWIGQWAIAIECEGIIRPRARQAIVSAPPQVIGGLHTDRVAARAQLNRMGMRRPYADFAHEFASWTLAATPKLAAFTLSLAGISRKTPQPARKEMQPSGRKCPRGSVCPRATSKESAQPDGTLRAA